jgi:arylsulfatase A-like enzyme
MTEEPPGGPRGHREVSVFRVVAAGCGLRESGLWGVRGMGESGTVMKNVFLRLLLGMVLMSPAAAAAGARPNVLFLFSDDQRADSIGALGNRQARTPSLDALAKRGTVFTKAYCMGSNQGAVCVPSRAMLMTGRPLRGIDEKLSVPTWPEAFGAAGYRTFASGKWHNGGESVRRCFREGRSVFLGGMVDPYEAKVVDFADGGKLTDPRRVAKHCVEQFADEAVTFLGSARDGEPWLCYVSFNAPHDPRRAPPEWHAKFRPEDMEVPANFLPQHPFDNGELAVRDEKLASFPRSEAELRRHLADYHAAIAFMDHQIGRIVAAIPAGQRDNTLIVFASDHGLAIGSHGLYGKQNLYEHSMRSPLMVAGPGVKAGQKSDALCYLLDIFPTLGSLAGVKGPEGSEGRDLSAVLRGESRAGREYITLNYRNVQRAVTDGRWKCIDYPVAGKLQLFDLASDPGEMVDLADAPGQAEVLAKLRSLLPPVLGAKKAKAKPPGRPDR